MNVPIGMGAWIWQWDRADRGQVSQIITRCNRTGIKWLAVCTNNSSMLMKLQNNIASLKAAGLGVYAWKYVYPDIVKAEIQSANLRIKSGIDGLILNPEIEWKVGHAQRNTSEDATALVQGIRDANPGTYLSYAPFALPGYHPDYPYTAFNSGCDSVMPQAYWTEFNDKGATPNLNRIDEQWAFWNRQNAGIAKPILPIGVTYGNGTPWGKPPGHFKTTDLADFLERYSSLPAISLYSYEAATEACWDYLERLENARQLAGCNLYNRLKGV